MVLIPIFLCRFLKEKSFRLFLFSFHFIFLVVITSKFIVFAISYRMKFFLSSIFEIIVNLIQDHELILPNYTYEHSKVFVILFYKEGFQIDNLSD